MEDFVVFVHRCTLALEAGDWPLACLAGLVGLGPGLAASSAVVATEAEQDTLEA
jgi:hypothetical protein